jgi:hypothetical protein
MDLDGNRRPETIDDKGAAHFVGIPGALRGKEVPIALEAAGYERSDSAPRKLTGETLYLPIRKSAGRLYGKVVNERGEPVVGASIDVEGLAAQTDQAGRFGLVVPGDRVHANMTLDIHAAGFEPQTLGVEPGPSEVGIALRRRRR